MLTTRSQKGNVAHALRMDWKQVLAPEKCAYILGNPPFVGGKYQTDEQRADMALVCAGCTNYGLLDFVTAWYFKAAEYIQGTSIVVSFVSTNSITQGEQVAPLWCPLFDRFNIRIHFAHRTFAWESEVRGKAHVHVVIIGFAAFNIADKRVHDYETDPEHATVSAAANISPYLTDGSNTTIASRENPIS